LFLFTFFLFDYLQKERDLELAARIGQSLLEQNKVLSCRNEELENELTASNESVRHIPIYEVYNFSIQQFVYNICYILILLLYFVG